jgi:hypothetical protein
MPGARGAWGEAAYSKLDARGAWGEAAYSKLDVRGAWGEAAYSKLDAGGAGARRGAAYSKSIDVDTGGADAGVKV